MKVHKSKPARPAKKKHSSTSKFAHIHYLQYDKPYDFDGLLEAYRAHQVAHLEHFETKSMERVFSTGQTVGRFRVSNDFARSRLKVEIDLPAKSAGSIPTILEQIRHMFDLDFEHEAIDKILRTHRRIHSIHKKHPGLRISSGWEPFEISISTILGQLVSTERARSLTNDLVDLFGEDSGLKREGIAIKLFPTPAQLAVADLTPLKTTRIRKKTLNAFAQAVIDKRISFDRDQDLDEFQKNMLAIYGIGPWTAAYVALKALKHSDAFPGTDLILARALELFPKGAIEKLRPHRSLVAMLLWREFASRLSKKKVKK